MSRFLSNDFINKDPRAKLTVAKMANIGDLVTPSAEYLTASGLTSLTVTAGCVVTVGSTGVQIRRYTVLGLEGRIRRWKRTGIYRRNLRTCSPYRGRQVEPRR